MELESLRAYLFKKKGAFEDFPFGPEAMVFKVRGKMFALVAWAESPLRINLKCDPDLALHLREVYKAIQPTMIDDSYDLVVRGLKKSDKEKLEKLSDD